MTDVVDKKTRSRMMSGIRNANTKPELIVRSGLHRLGFRYRLHDARVPGKPDLLFPSRKSVIFVHGCFWHLHNCHLFKWPSTRPAWWREKLERNRTRDAKVRAELLEMGWRVLVIWECALKGKHKRDQSDVIAAAAEWLESATELDANPDDDSRFQQVTCRSEELT